MTGSLRKAGNEGETPPQCGPVLRLDERLERFKAEEPRAAEVLEFRYFGGLKNEEIAAALEMTVATMERDLRFARAWLTRAWEEDGRRPGRDLTS